jgi:hypothetical protein
LQREGRFFKIICFCFIEVNILSTGASSLLNRLVRDGKKVSNFVTWFSVGAPVATGVLNPILLDIQYKRQHKPEKERKLLVEQEVGKQVINVVTLLSLWQLTMLGTRQMFKRYADQELLKSKVGQAGKAAIVSLLTNISGLISLAVISPMATPGLLKAWKKAHHLTPPVQPAQVNGNLNVISQSKDGGEPESPMPVKVGARSQNFGQLNKSAHLQFSGHCKI